MTKRGGKAVVFCPAAKFFLRWPSKSVIINKHSYSMSVRPTTKSAGVLELADETDSKSHSSVVTTSAEVLDFSRKFDNSICK